MLVLEKKEAKTHNHTPLSASMEQVNIFEFLGTSITKPDMVISNLHPGEESSLTAVFLKETSELKIPVPSFCQLLQRSMSVHHYLFISSHCLADSSVRLFMWFAAGVQVTCGFLYGNLWLFYHRASVMLHKSNAHCLGDASV